MDAHHLGRSRGGNEAALQKISANALVISIHSDILFPEEEGRFLADNIPGAVFHLIDSPYGHDGFLLEFEQISTAIRQFLQSDRQKQPKAGFAV
jgi:homoserine O-acetyltransferase